MTHPNVPSIAFIEKNLLATGQKFGWLYEIEVPTNPPTRYRFVRDQTPVTFRGIVYSPFPITHSETRSDAKGNLPTITLTASNVTREIVSVLNTYNGLVGQPVRIILTHDLALPTSHSVWEHDYQIRDLSINEEAVSATLGDVHIFEAKIPGQTMLRFYCRHQYMDAHCGYAVGSGDANYLSTCDKSLSGANGCRVHGVSEGLAGLPNLHPERFGGFPGIPEQTTTGGLR